MDQKPGKSAPAEEFRVSMSLTPLSPRGDLSKRDDEPFQKAFKRKVKAAGKSEHGSDWLPYRPEAMQGDTPGVSVRKAPKDEVC